MKIWCALGAVFVDHRQQPSDLVRRWHNGGSLSRRASGLRRRGQIPAVDGRIVTNHGLLLIVSDAHGYRVGPWYSMGTPLFQGSDGDMVKKTQPKEASQRRWRAGRLSMRAHSDLKRGLEFLAQTDKRTVSQYVELVLLAHVHSLLKNQFDSSGALASGDRNEAFVLREPWRRPPI